jgi:hypothetical protein
MKQQRSQFDEAVYHAQLVVASGKSPIATKKGPGRKHVQGCSEKVKEAAKGFNFGKLSGTDFVTTKGWSDVL